ncbi:MAG: hypothetical protein K1060chlam1_00954 [Candidatus Anoxychlamydiales bacterium]|nr:hypothetical protein [Candidatus Anoxychlamydiales bacterium]
MISSPVYYYRQFENDLNHFIENPYIQKTKKIFNVALPFLSLYGPIQRPLTIGLSALRAATHIPSIFYFAYNKNYKKASFSFFNSFMGTLAVSSAIFNNAKGMAVSSFHDSLISLKDFFNSIKKGDYKEITENSFNALNNSLFLALLVFGNIEFVVISLAFQIAFELYKSFDDFKEKNYIECFSHIVMSVIRAYQLKPQAKLAFWKWTTDLKFEGTIRQAKNGFIYLDIDDEFIYQINKLFKENNMEVPPYFGKDRAGAHISIFSAEEAKKYNLFNIDDIGKKITFDISYFTNLKPLGFKGVDNLSMVGLNSSELEKIRQKYSLSSKMHGSHDFHITTGVKYKHV